MDFLLGTVLYFCIFYGYNAQQTGNSNFVCRDEEEFNTCRSPCQLTCENIKRGTGIPNCSRSCVEGCFCRTGFVRADDNTCVRSEDCFRSTRRVCGENEEYLDCGSPCLSNCTNLNEAIFCTKPCERGCFCKYDFVRDSSGKCVHRRNCLAGNQQCPANEEYVTCVNFCNTCSENSNCRTTYCKSGCDCKYGYYRNANGECVTAEECYYSQYDSQPKCRSREIYTSCVNECNDCVSRGRCDYDPFFCSPGCDCIQGYFRNERGVCVPEWNCYGQGPPLCPPEEQYYDCIPRCRNTCDNYNDPNVRCDTTCVKGCFCRTGYVLRRDGECVLPRDCPARNLPCPPGEVFYQCPPTCRTSCQTLNFRGICSTDCRPGCFCQPTFVRNDVGRCIRPEDCPAQTVPGGGFEGRRGPTLADPRNETTTTLIPITTAKDDPKNETTAAMPTTIKETTTTTIPTTETHDIKKENSSIPTTASVGKTETLSGSSNSSVSDTTAIKTTTVPQSNAETSSPPSTETLLTTPEKTTIGLMSNAPTSTKDDTTPNVTITEMATSTDLINATATNSTT